MLYSQLKLKDTVFTAFLFKSRIHGQNYNLEHFAFSKEKLESVCVLGVRRTHLLSSLNLVINYRGIFR